MSQQVSKKNPTKTSVREGNIIAARAVSDSIRTSLGPRGMDKMISSPNGQVVISNDGATILEKMEILHPAARMLVDLAHSQDVEAGDGTTTVTIIAGALLAEAQRLLNMGLHPSIISDGYLEACEDAMNAIRECASPISLHETEDLLNSARTSLGSKVVSQYSSLLAPIAVEAVLKVIDPDTASNVDLRNIRVVKLLGGTIDETELIDGIVFSQKTSKSAGGPTEIKDAKIGLIQFTLSSPKTNIDHKTVIQDYQQLDRALKQERTYLFNLCKKIRDTGCNVLLIQKSILRDAVNDLSLQFLARMKIMVIKDIERSEIEFISKTTGAIPIASIESFNESKLGSAELVEETSTSGGKVVIMTGIPNQGETISVLVRGSNNLILDEAERSLHDALCVVRSLVKEKFLIPGGGAPEIEGTVQLTKLAMTKKGLLPTIYRHYASALEVIPYTLAENAGLHPIEIVTELRSRHNNGEKYCGINVKKGEITDMIEEKVTQPLLVTLSALRLATQTVCQILKIDDTVLVR